MSFFRLKGFNRKKLPLILQEEIGECGQACIAMIACFFGHMIDLQAIRSRFFSSQHGMNLEKMATIFSELGLEMRVIRLETEHLKYLKCPVILYWNSDHFVVLKKVTRSVCVIYDPAVGICRYRKKEYHQQFSGIAIEVFPTIDFKPIMATSSLRFFNMIQLIPGFKQGLLWLSGLSIIVELFQLISPLYLQYMVDHVMMVGEEENVRALVFGFLLLGGFQFLLSLGRQHFMLYLKMNWIEQFSSFVMQHLVKLPLLFFQLRHKGDLQSKFGSIEEIEKKVGTDFVTAVLDGGMVILSGLVMSFYSLKLIVLSASVLSIYFFIRYLGYIQWSHSMMTSLKKHGEVATFFLESLHAMMTIKVFSKERDRFMGWRRRWIDALNIDIHNERRQIFLQQLGHWFAHLEASIAIGVGALCVLNHSLSLGMLLAFLSYRDMFVARAYSCIHHWIDYRLIHVSLARINDILSYQQEEEDPLIRGDQDHLFTGHLSLQDVSFRYDDSQPFLFSSLSLTINAGEKVAIIGPSGCGKSTLLKLMMGLLKPTQGQICIDEYPLAMYGSKRYRTKIAAVLQEDILFSGSILENIIFFEDSYDLDEVIKAAKTAAIHETIMSWPLQYHSRIGDMGSMLSGGQKQRLLLARALYKKPTILFLDEATSHLDILHESAINEALSRLKITQVIVAHRQETIRMADRVIDLDSRSEKN